MRRLTGPEGAGADGGGAGGVDAADEGALSGAGAGGAGASGVGDAGGSGACDAGLLLMARGIVPEPGRSGGGGRDPRAGGDPRGRRAVMKRMSRRLLTAWGLLAILAAAPAPALADPPAASAPAAPSTAAAPAPSPAPPPLPAAAPAKPVTKAAAPKAAAKKGKKKGQEGPITGPIATYPGFRMLDGGGSRVFVTLSKKVNVTEHKAQGRLTYRIQGVRVPARTNRLPLVTTFFSTPVSRAELVERDGDVDLVIDVRAATTAQFRIVESDKGAELQVDFPKVTTDEPAAAAAEPAAPATAASRPATTKSLDTKAGTAY